MREQRVPLFFLEACQTAVAEKDPTASVAGTLLQGGVSSVVAMSHSVLVETARRFVGEFYEELLAGRAVGEAMVAGQRKLKAESLRYRTFTGELHLEDWFVPVLFQEEEDPQLIRAVPRKRVKEVLAKQRRLSLGELPAEPEHGFVGRSRELLTAERVLEGQPYVVLRGEGGEGKTTLAAELVRWLVLTRRFERAAFASLEKHGDARTLLFALGSQLVTDFASHAGHDVNRGWLEVERALRERRTLLVLDNMESVLPPEEGAASVGVFEPEVLKKVLDLAAKLNGVDETRVVFTSRQAMPSPFAANHVTIGRLWRREAIELVARTLGKEEQAPRADDSGESEDEVARLVDAVGCHARSLVLLAREVAEAGVRNATERLGELMARLQERYPGDRERSLYASVELSLRRLPAGMREAIRPLGVFQGGGQLTPMAQVLGFDLEKPELIRAVAASLVRVGLAEGLEYGYVRLDPALGPLLLSEMSEAERSEARDRWATAMALFTELLYRQQSRDDPRMASALTLLDLANVLGALEHSGVTAPPEIVVDVATNVEALLHNLGRPKALAQASRVREAAMAALREWSHARFVGESEAVDRLLDEGRFPEAIAAARAILERTQAAGENPYAGAGYDLAVAHVRLGRALRRAGAAAAALAPLREAQGRFQALADAGDPSAARMASVALVDTGDCLRALGQLDEAASAYEEAIGRAEQLKDARQVAVNKGQLAGARMLQMRYAEALAAYEDARRTFEQLGELRSLAVAWHQIGTVHQSAGHRDEAEKAYQASLRIKVQTGDRSGEASTLDQLGNLYDRMGRLEEAVGFHQQAATIHRGLKDRAGEGRSCYNLACTLVKLGRLDDARREILRAIECDEPFGHAAEPWKTFTILTNIERAAGNTAAAVAARQRAIDAYLAHRRDGGENLSGGGRLCAVVEQAITAKQVAAAEPALAELAGRADLPAYLRPLLPKLQAILHGARDSSLAADPDLDYDDAAELQLLLDRVAKE
jgi:tetratricopeptide (TPR) repeat protein